MKKVAIFCELKTDIEEVVNNKLKKLQAKHKIIDIKISASRYSETVMIIYD